MHFTGGNLNEGTRSARVGVLLVNLGTPEAPTRAAVARYLAEFLADPRVVEIPKWLWWPVLHGVILRTRPAKSARAYQTIWRPEGSPLAVYSANLVAALKREFPRDSSVAFALAMRYGSPTIAQGLDELHRAGADRLLVLPLYPQYSGATTGSVFDAVADRLRRQRFVPELRFINDYHADPGYIDALAESVRAFWATNGPSEYLLISFHGLPRRNCETGDPYAIRCAETTRRLAERLGLPREQWEQTYQSRFGPQRWLEPYLDSRLRSLPAAGKRQIDILCPGFAVDCLETLEEVAVRGKETFIAAGGERLRYIPALNDTTRHVQVLADLIRHNLAGWPDSAGD